jgi:preprotein translocase SecE subunit
VARDRKRAKQRQQRRGAQADPKPAPARLARADLPGALEHVGDVDEFDAALVRGAGGVPVEPDALPEAEPEGGGELAGNGAGSAERVQLPARAAGERQPLPLRAVAFLQASWAELQRVQWPDRRQVTQATAVVLGFVAVAGAYFGLADFVAKEIVEVIL